MRTVVDGLHPMIVATTENGTPESSIRVQPVCRRRVGQALSDFELPGGRSFVVFEGAAG
jgi:hypothetical protein